MKRAVGFFAGFLLITFFAGILPAVASAPEDEDFGVWTSFDLETRVKEDWKLHLGEDVRFRDAGGLFYYETHAGLQHQTLDWLALGGEYVHIRSASFSKGKNHWTWESRPRFYATPIVKWRGWVLEDRNMMEFRFRQNAENTMRYRNRVTVSAPWRWTAWKIQPFAANEIFLETSRNGLIQNRFFSGFRFQPGRHLKCSLYYMRQSQKNNAGHWRDANILGTSAAFIF